VHALEVRNAILQRRFISTAQSRPAGVVSSRASVMPR